MGSKEARRRWRAETKEILREKRRAYRRAKGIRETGPAQAAAVRTPRLKAWAETDVEYFWSRQ